MWQWTRPFQGQFVVRRLRLAMINTHTKFEVSSTPHSGTSSSILCSPIPSTITSSSSDSPLCTSITPSVFLSRLKTYLFHKYYPLSFTSSSRAASTDFCLHLFFWTTRFLILIFSLFFIYGPCARLSWPSRQLLGARKSTIVSYL